MSQLWSTRTSRKELNQALAKAPGPDARAVNSQGGTPEQCRANADCLAAARELLEACKGLWEAQSRLSGSLPTWFNEAAEAARAAIAKAEGRADCAKSVTQWLTGGAK